MKKIIFVLLFLGCIPGRVLAQIEDGPGIDSFIVRFSDTATKNFVPDTASVPLWQAGRTFKPFFTSDTSGAVGIMTDTAGMYPVNADHSFVVRVRSGFTTLFSFWHRFQTDSSKDGGMVEFSQDNGLTWYNVIDSCNLDSGYWFNAGIFTANFYTENDTLENGLACFNGTRASVLSRVQFQYPLPIKPTAGHSCVWSCDTFYVRFRFLSDSTYDSLAGWLIDSIKVKRFAHEGFVQQIARLQKLTVFPNPSFDGIFGFPELFAESRFRIFVYNTLGQCILQQQYSRSIDLGCFPDGVFFYRVTDGGAFYSGTLLKE